MVEIPRFRWSVDEYDKLIQHGILTKYHKVELLRGEVVLKKPKGDLDAGCRRRLTRIFSERAAESALISVQCPIRLADSVPEPDLTLLARRPDFYASGKPGPAAIYLVVEVADTSLDYDREVKGPLYAENGIAEYWIVNLVDHCLEVHRQPQADGTYVDVRTLRVGDSLSLALLPAVFVAVSELMP